MITLFWYCNAMNSYSRVENLNIQHQLKCLKLPLDDLTENKLFSSPVQKWAEVAKDVMRKMNKLLSAVVLLFIYVFSTL